MTIDLAVRRVCPVSSPQAHTHAGITSLFNDDLFSLAVKTVVMGSPEDWLLSLCVCVCVSERWLDVPLRAARARSIIAPTGAL